MIAILLAVEFIFQPAVIAAERSEAPVVIEAPAALLWTDVPEVLVEGAAPSGKVTITATMVDAVGISWSSKGTYHADADGKVKVGTSASTSGTYTGTDGRGLIWSMLPASLEDLSACAAVTCLTKGAPNLPRLPVMDGVTINYSAAVETSDSTDGFETVSAKTTAYFAEPGVSRTEVVEGSLRGVYFSPKGSSSRSAVMVLTGSGGGAAEATAALLASQGFAAFAIAYFNYEGRPKELSEIPLEYFRDGVDWLRAKTGVERIALMGGSRGGEAVLLIASTWPEKVSAVVSSVPSNVAWPGCCGPAAAAKASWTLNGAAVPTTAYAFKEGEGFDTQTKVSEWRTFFLPGMLAEGEGRIIVEKIDAPILFVTGRADAVWPSSIAAALMKRRLERTNYPYPIRHLEYSGAGHLAGAPLPVTSMADQLTHPLTKERIVFGGTPAQNALAGINSFAEILDFLKNNPGRKK